MIYKTIPIEIDYFSKGLEHSGHQVTLKTYVIENSPEMDINRRRPAVIICPGGGYEFKSEREAQPIALAMNAYGFQAFVLDYSVAPSRFPCALAELAKAVELVRNNAEIWHINPDKIIVAGFSAGGHLAASLGVFWHQEWLQELLETTGAAIQPNGLLLNYPVITSGEFAHQGSFKALLGEENLAKKDLVSLEKHVTSQVPPTFMWHTEPDGAVPVENALLFAMSLRQHKVSQELHIFKEGGHGLSLANEETRWMGTGEIQEACQEWVQLFAKWLKTL